MNAEKINMSLYSIMFWTRKGFNDPSRLEDALRIIESKVEAIREEMRGMDPIETEFLRLTILSPLER